MGKKKKPSLGRTLIKEKFGGHQKSRNPSDPSWHHTTELPDGYDWGRLNMRSVTEQSALDEFLSTAALAGTEFVAEKQNVQIVHPETSGILTKEEEQSVKDAQEENRKFLRIPRRPEWDESTTREQLESMERDTFLKWRRKLALLQENDPRLILTPYEKNLDIWRQLWRVIERSDVICQIVDARNPLLFKCDDLAAYVKEMDSSKQNLVLINKADFLTEHQRIYWTEYFDKRATEVAFWSALNETEKHEKEIQENKMSEMLQIKMNLNDNENKSSNAEVLSPESHVNETDNEADSKHLSVTTATKLVWDEETESLDQTNSVCGTSETCERFIGTTENLPSIPCNDSDHNENGPEDLEEYPNTPIQNSPKMLSKTELIDLLRSRRISNEENGSKSITIGLVGYPNVGKSSTINALLADKKTSVSATPGKTKHFQTLLTDDGLCLCDCPGLVFPTFVSTKAEMVIGGILPIDEMRDYVPPVNLLTKLIPRHVLEHVYGINIPSPREGENPGRPPTADEFLSVYASMRGFMSSHGSPDCSRASRYVLKDFVNGKLLYCQPPPGVEVDDFLPCYTATKIPARNQKEEKYSQKRQKTILNKVDKEFFSQADATPNYKVPSGLKAAGLTSTIHEPIGKPWKKHYNRNKKEKLRRLSKP